ncbi:hypothetical protein O181_031412 [Austropuccinia psidii MF-1]|uniref:Uncharacterized protein n=1 Tax=Austropuccinia psidii MF-1 TaxID=1389203 RepID=A0A9Q3H5B9_9BASI|nr:hypothetical protein [Austropuccinia psidii MF-1]
MPGDYAYAYTPPSTHLRHIPSLRFHTPASSSLKLTMLMLPHFPLTLSIYHPCTQTIIGFQTEGCSFAKFTILPLP